MRDEVGLLPAEYAAYDASVSIGSPGATTSPVNVNDAFSNPVARLGAGTQNLLEATRYPLTRMSQNWNLLNSLYRTNWVVKNIVSVIPEDVTKKWFKIGSSDKSIDMNKFKNVQEQMNLRQSVIRGMKWGRLYGGAVGLLLISGPQNLEEPLDLRTIMPDSFHGIYVIDRWSGVYPSRELVTDMTDPDFGLPDFYIIRDTYGVERFKVHHSRIIRFVPAEMPYFEAIAEQYWGQSVIESIYEEIVKKDNVSYNIASLTFKANLDVVEMEGIDQLFALGGYEAQKRFWNLVQAQSVLQSNFGTRVINKGDKFNQYQYAFTGLRDVYEVLLFDVAGAARIPATRLFSRSPQGLNATGESDQKNYDEYLDEVRESDFKPIIHKILPVLALSTWGKIPKDMQDLYEAIRTPTEEEKATIAQRKVGILLDSFNANAIPRDILLTELKGMSDLIGVYASITDEMIKDSVGVYKKDIDILQDVVAGITVPNPLEPDEPVEQVNVREV